MNKTIKTTIRLDEPMYRMVVALPGKSTAWKIRFLIAKALNITEHNTYIKHDDISS
jgi:hypothetical protein